AAEGRSKRHASEASLVEQEDIKARRLQHKYGGVESVSVALEVAFNEMEEDRVEIIKIMGVNVGFNLDGSRVGRERRKQAASFLITVGDEKNATRTQQHALFGNRKLARRKVKECSKIGREHTKKASSKQETVDKQGSTSKGRQARVGKQETASKSRQARVGKQESASKSRQARTDKQEARTREKESEFRRETEKETVFVIMIERAVTVKGIKITGVNVGFNLDGSRVSRATGAHAWCLARKKGSDCNPCNQATKDKSKQQVLITATSSKQETVDKQGSRSKGRQARVGKQGSTSKGRQARVDKQESASKSRQARVGKQEPISKKQE
ncbi:hypothetical protein Tco_0953575, partial [Tanacetum coccineum]